VPPQPPARAYHRHLLFGLRHFPLHLRIFPRTRCAVPGTGEHGHGAVDSGVAGSGRPVCRVEAPARLNALLARVAGVIATQGPISVAQYMTLALHDPDSAYYAPRDPIGADFIP